MAELLLLPVYKLDSLDIQYMNKGKKDEICCRRETSMAAVYLCIKGFICWY